MKKQEQIDVLDARVTWLENRTILKPDYHPDDVATIEPQVKYTAYLFAVKSAQEARERAEVAEFDAAKYKSLNEFNIAKVKELETALDAALARVAELKSLVAKWNVRGVTNTQRIFHLEAENHELHGQLIDAQEQLDINAANYEALRQEALAVTAERDTLVINAGHYAGILSEFNLPQGSVIQFIKDIKADRDRYRAQAESLQTRLNHVTGGDTKCDFAPLVKELTEITEQRDALLAEKAAGVRVSGINDGSGYWHNFRNGGINKDDTHTAILICIEPIEQEAVKSFGITSLDPVYPRAGEPPSPDTRKGLADRRMNGCCDATNNYESRVDKTATSIRRYSDQDCTRDVACARSNDRRKPAALITVSSATSITSIGSGIGGGYCEGPGR